MTTSQLLARHFKEFLHGNSMTGSHIKEHLDDITMLEATTQIADLNTIAVLTYHINYYIVAQIGVLEGDPLNAKDSLSFNLTPITEMAQWDMLRKEFYQNIERFAKLVQELSSTQLEDIFVLEKYGSYHRNIIGLSEHSHYHLGQIVLLKRLIRSGH